MHNQAPIQRRKSTRIYVGNVPIGDGAPIAVQSMTNTRTTDVEATVNQNTDDISANALQRLELI